MIKRSWLIGVVMAASVGGAAGQTQSVLPEGMTQFSDGTGVPYAGGHVYMYIPATTTPKTTYQDPYAKTPNANPITLDANGRAIVWGSGVYRQVLQDALGQVVWDQLTSAALVSGSGGSVLWYGLATGTSNSITLGPLVGFTATDGQVIGFVANASNTGATTINPNGYGAVLLQKNTAMGVSPAVGGEIIQGNTYYVTYSTATSSFVLGGGSFFSATQSSAGNEPLGTLQVTKNTTYTGGTVGNLEAAAWVQNTVGTGVKTSQLAVFGYLQNYATAALPAAQNVGVGGYGKCMAVGCSATWGGWFVGEDASGQADPTKPLLATEFDVMASGTDANLARAGIVIVGSKPSTGGAAPTLTKAVSVGDANDGTVWTTAYQVEAHHVGTELNMAAANATYGAYFSGNVATATIADTTNSPSSVSVGGSHSFAVFADASSSAGTGLLLNGTYTASAVRVASGGVALFDVLPTGAVDVLKGSLNVVDAGAGYYIHGTAGSTATKTAGACTFTIIGGLITNVAGC